MSFETAQERFKITQKIIDTLDREMISTINASKVLLYQDKDAKDCIEYCKVKK